MNVIEELKYHEANELEDWINYDEKKQKKFLRELVKFSNENRYEIELYCINTIPTEFSSLSIVYEALSTHSSNFNDFLKEIQRVVTLVKEGKTEPENLEVLQDIDMEDIYSKDVRSYIKVMDYLTSNLQLNLPRQFNLQLLDIIDWYLIELDQDDDISESTNWMNQIKNLAINGETKVKSMAKKTLKSIDMSETSKSSSLFDIIKGFFK